MRHVAKEAAEIAQLRAEEVARFPEVPDDDRIRRSMLEFRRALSDPVVTQHPCAVCGIRCYTDDVRVVAFDSDSDEDRELLAHARIILALGRMPSARLSLIDADDEEKAVFRAMADKAAGSVMETEPTFRPPPPPIQPNHGMVLDAAGLSADGKTFTICTTCCKCLSKGDLPALAIANDNWLGDVPPELSELTVAEQLLISPYRYRNIVFKLKTWIAGEGSDRNLCARGNVITFSQDVHAIRAALPLSVADLRGMMSVAVIGPEMPVRDSIWLKRLMEIRQSYVERALKWLSRHNLPWAEKCSIDLTALRGLPENGIPDELLEAVVLLPESESELKESASYASVPEFAGAAFSPDSDISVHASGVFDVDGRAVSGSEKRAAAVRNILAGEQPRHLPAGPYLLLPHDKVPARETEPHFVELCHPWLYPYGIGGPELSVRDRKRRVYVSEERLAKRALMLQDRRFAVDPAWMYVTLNRIQRRQAKRCNTLSAQSESFRKDASLLQSLSASSVAASLRKLNPKDVYADLPVSDPSRPQLQTLFRRVQAVQYKLPGTNEARKKMRYRAYSMVTFLGVPAFFVTLNPSDTNNPLCLRYAGVKLALPLAGDDLPSGMPSLMERAKIVAANPVAAAEFFHRVVRAFID
jgi:hypothetical protein